METFSEFLALCVGTSTVTGEFPSQRPVTRNFEVFFDLGVNKRLSKQSWGWWFETPSLPLWRHSNDYLKTSHVVVFDPLCTHKDFLSTYRDSHCYDKTTWQHCYLHLKSRVVVMQTVSLVINSGSLQWRHYEHDGVSNHQPHDCWTFIQAQIKENIKAPRHWPLCGEFTNSYQRGKCFHLMTSSCVVVMILASVVSDDKVGILPTLDFRPTLFPYIKMPIMRIFHWNWNVVILTKFTPRDQPEIIISTNPCGISDDFSFNVTTCPFQCLARGHQ